MSAADHVFTIEEQIACIRRELALRKNVYPKFVESGRMKQSVAVWEIACMQAVHDTIAALDERR